MNRTVLSTALLGLLCTTAQADITIQQQPLTTTKSAPATMTAPAPAAATTTVTPTIVKPTTTTLVVPTTPAAQQAIDCKYRLPAETSNIEQSLVSSWAKQAATQSFNFNPTSVDDELSGLKDCYTDQGWQGFNDALQKSGNIGAIKSQHLTVSSQVDGEMTINLVKDNQWKVTVPLQVVYQNDKEKLTQLLAVDLVIGRKISGDLGIMQMIATPRNPTGNQQAPAVGETNAPATSTPASTTTPTEIKKPTLPAEQKPTLTNEQPVTQAHP